MVTEKAELINDMTRELGLEEGFKAEIHIELLKKTLKKISNWKTPGHDGIHGFWFKKFTSIHDRLALEMNRCLQDAQVPDWMTKEKTILIKKDPSKGIAPNNYRPITCLLMMWKISTAQTREEIYYSLISCGLFPDEHKGCRKWSRGIAELLYIDQHILNESKYRRKNLDRLQKGIWYVPAMMDNKLSQNVQNITRNHKLHRKNHAKLESWINSRRKKLSWNKDSKRYFSRRCTVTPTIHNCHDATKPHTQKMHGRIQT